MKKFALIVILAMACAHIPLLMTAQGRNHDQLLITKELNPRLDSVIAVYTDYYRHGVPSHSGRQVINTALVSLPNYVVKSFSSSQYLCPDDIADCIHRERDAQANARCFRLQNGDDIGNLCEQEKLTSMEVDEGTWYMLITTIDNNQVEIHAVAISGN